VLPARQGADLQALPPGQERRARRETTEEAAGRDPTRFEVIVCANVAIVPKPLGADRPIFCGTMDQIGEDALRVRQMGVAELFFDPTLSGDITAEGISTSWSACGSWSEGAPPLRDGRARPGTTSAPGRRFKSRAGYPECYTASEPTG
jgi:hypothetical protein